MDLMVDNPIIFITLIITLVIILLIILMIMVFMKLRTNKAVLKAASQLKMITESITAGVINFNIDKRFVINYASEAFYEILKKPKDKIYTLNKKDLLDYITVDEKGEFIKYFNDLISSLNSNVSLETKMITNDGGIIDVTITGQLTHGPTPYVSATVIEITKIKLMQQQLSIDKERYEISSLLSNSIVFEYDMIEDKMQFSEKYKDIFGRQPIMENYISNIEKNKEWIHPDDQGLFLEFNEKVTNSNEIIVQEFRIRDAFGGYLWCEVSGKAIVYDNKPIKVIGKVTNINTYKNALNELEYKATRDPLTSIYNKETIEIKIENYINANRYKKHMVIFVDFDDFKNINDKYGHIKGDQVLKEVTNTLKETLVEGEMIGRIGGDEFVVFIGNIGEDDVIKKSDIIINSVNGIYEIGKESIPVSVSMGVSIYPEDGNNYEKLLIKADEALYIAKGRGKLCYHICNKDE
ncbi:MAG TPA: diguanylate cyclase [Clostridiales bacterium]|nr:diguanylate cyclase [Clostridiales bacterium]